MTISLQRLAHRAAGAALRLWQWVHAVEMQAIMQLRMMARAVASWRASQTSRAWRRWLGVARAVRVASISAGRWRGRRAWRALHGWRGWVEADRRAERLLTSAGIRWRASGCAKALGHWATLAELRRRLWAAAARMRSRGLWRAWLG